MGGICSLSLHPPRDNGCCTCANYCTFAMCEGVLQWLLVKEPNFKVASQKSWEIVAERPFKLGRIERKVTAPAEPSRKVRTRPVTKTCIPNKKGTCKKPKEGGGR